MKKCIEALWLIFHVNIAPGRPVPPTGSPPAASVAAGCDTGSQHALAPVTTCGTRTHEVERQLCPSRDWAVSDLVALPFDQSGAVNYLLFTRSPVRPGPQVRSRVHTTCLCCFFNG